MKLKTFTRQEVFDLPLSEIIEMNKHWRLAIKQHWNLWTYECLKKQPRTFDEFLLDQEELKELHFQFRWEAMTASQRLQAKFPSQFSKPLKNEGYDPGSAEYPGCTQK